MRQIIIRYTTIILVMLGVEFDAEAQNSNAVDDPVITSKWYSKRHEKALWLKLESQSRINPVALKANQLWKLRIKGFDFIPEYDWSNDEINIHLKKSNRNKALPTFLQVGGILPVFMGALVSAFGYPESGVPILAGGGLMILTGTGVSIGRKRSLNKRLKRVKEIRSR